MINYTAKYNTDIFNILYNYINICNMFIYKDIGNKILTVLIT